MSATRNDRPGLHAGESDLSRTYIRVLVVEVIVVTSLYFLGRYFG